MSEIHNYDENVIEKLSSEPKNFWKRFIIFLFILALVIWGNSGSNFQGITEKGMNVAKAILNGILHPETMLFNFSSKGIPMLLLETISIAFLGTLIGALLAIPFAFLSATNIVPRWISLIFRAITMMIRTIPALMWALIWIRVTGPGAFCGVVTQSIASIGMVSKMYITAIENLDTGVLEALDAAGCNTFEKIRVGIIPQLSASFISTAIYRFDINLKDATILGIVGAGGIGFPLNDAISNARWNRVGAFVICLVALVLVIEWISTKIRARLAHGKR